MDPLFWTLVAGSIGSGVAAASLALPERRKAAPEPEERPEPLLTKFRCGREALAMNVFPRAHDAPCASCRSLALVWARDHRRSDAWVASCAFCGIHRLDVVAGVTLEP